jgi:hypothetical protein
VWGSCSSRIEEETTRPRRTSTVAPARAWTLGSIGGLIVGFTHASAGATYLISFGLLAIGLGILLGPERVRLWREMHGSSPTRHREGR